MHLGIFTGIDRPTVYQKLIIGNPGMFMAISPSLYLFTKKLVQIRLKPRFVLNHFIPALIFYVLSLFYDETQPTVLIETFSSGGFHPIGIIADHWNFGS